MLFQELRVTSTTLNFSAMNVRLRMAGLLFGMSFGLYAQQVSSTGLQELETAGWYRYTGDQSLSAESFIEQYRQQLGLGEKDRLELQRVSYGKDGSEHRHYQQMHQGIPVEAAELIIHLRNNAVYLANGEIVSDLNLNPEASISESQALQYALNYFPAQIFAWEANGEASPQGNLVILDKNFSKDAQQYQLSWKFDVYSYKPYDRNWVYINAQNGSLSHSLSRIHSQDTGTARTKYSGTRSIYTSYDSDSALYVLHDSLTGGGIYTFNMQKRTNKGTAIDFYDDDNYWNNFNANFDEAATDAHWGAERVYSYFKQHYNRFSYDDQNSPLNSFVHYDSNYVNAFWNGQEMTYGDGNGVASTPLISLDVVAHEITHGITEYTASLIYQGEAGALNESFSDIFGVAIEFAYDSAGGDWKMGEMDGKGEYFFSDGGKYIGDWKNGIQNGVGIQIWANGDSYSGEIKNNQSHGYGVKTDKIASCEGNFINNKMNGEFLCIFLATSSLPDPVGPVIRTLLSEVDSFSIIFLTFTISGLFPIKSKEWKSLFSIKSFSFFSSVDSKALLT